MVYYGCDEDGVWYFDFIVPAACGPANTDISYWMVPGLWSDYE